MLSIPQALQRIKGNLHDYLGEKVVTSLVRDLRISYRQRILTPLITTHLFLRQVLHGNKPVAELKRIAKLPFSESAYCEARQRLPLAFFQRLHYAVLGRCRSFDADNLDALWCGRHRVFFLDGSSFSMPDTDELRREFGYPAGQKPGCGFPTAHLMVQFDAHSGYLVRVFASPRNTHDMANTPWMHKDLRPGDIVGGDRAFCSYAHLALLDKRDCFGLFRAHQRLIVSFQSGRPHVGPGESTRGKAGLPRSRWVKRLGRDDQIVEYFKPAECPDWLSPTEYAALPATLLVRELRLQVRTPGGRVSEITLVTTLLDKKRYSKAALGRLYERRWGAEVNLRHLKETLGMDVLRCGTYKGVLKELLVFVTIYNLVRRVMVEAARRQSVSPERISFADALRWLREAEAGEELPRLKVNRLRPRRVEPRVRKRRPKQFKLMNKPRKVLQDALLHKTAPPKGDTP